MRILSKHRAATCGGLAIILLAACGGEAPEPVTGESAIAMDDDDIAGVVRSAAGPEAGVWVIAETDDFDTRFARIVVTDDQGRYLVPDLPDASYQLWVRGYGLQDSRKVAGFCDYPDASLRTAAQPHQRRLSYWRRAGAGTFAPQSLISART